MTLIADHLAMRERAGAIVAMAVARAWKDSEYRRDLVARPKAVLAEEGFECPDGVDLEIVQDTPTAKYVSLPPDAADSTTSVSLVEQALPLETGRELRLVQSSETKWYIVLPQAPAGLQLEGTPELVLNRAAAVENGWVWTVTNVAAVAEAAAVALAVIT
ncbi:nitrile hydratase subunit alpha [Streptomyces sp. NPDC058086]|uniref:nitrile hydratase subunit alpha n=1 Tax=Streptomyces sp. NPDC058086 TaxID=3346334 RepID=UPI0036F1862F